MNKRIQKKIASKAAQAKAEAQSPVKPVAAALKDVEKSAQQLVRSVLHEAEELAGEAVTQVRARVAQTQERAEALLEKVPGVGAPAAKALHKVGSP